MNEESKDLVDGFQGIFVEELPDSLPSRREIDSEINLKSDEPAPVHTVIRLSSKEFKELKDSFKYFLTGV